MKGVRVSIDPSLALTVERTCGKMVGCACVQPFTVRSASNVMYNVKAGVASRQSVLAGSVQHPRSRMIGRQRAECHQLHPQATGTPSRSVRIGGSHAPRGVCSLAGVSLYVYAPVHGTVARAQ
jgi:hypothetical protein